jgi:glycosyltransferase involved in cell wall biosynthesis
MKSCNSLNNLPLVSVIIPTYKRPTECVRAVRSVLLQTFQDFEIIVGDDFGSDQTEALLLELNDPRIRYFKNGDAGGSASKNRNLCLSRSRGICLTFLDSDDFMLPRKLELQVAALQASGSEVGFAIAGTRVVKVCGGKYYRYNDLIPTTEGDLKAAYFGRKLSCYNTSLMVRRDALDAVGSWDPSAGPYDDSELILRLLLRYNAVRIEQVSTLWFDHDGEDSFSNDQVARRLGLEAFITKHENLIADYPVWGNFRIKELAKVLFVVGHATQCRQWLKRLSGRWGFNVRMMNWLTYLPGYTCLLHVIYPVILKLNKPNWLNADPVSLGDLVPEEYIDAMKPIL